MHERQRRLYRFGGGEFLRQDRGGFRIFGAAAQALTPNFFKNRKSPFDSVKLIVNMKYVCGDPSVRQTFNIYRLRDSLAYTTDTIYYHSFRYEDHIDSEPLFSFEYSGEPDEIEEIKLDILPQGQLLLDELAAADTTLFYSDKAYESCGNTRGSSSLRLPELLPMQRYMPTTFRTAT